MDDASTRDGKTAANSPQGENLSGYLHRIKFSLDSVECSPHKPSAGSLNGASTGGLKLGSFEPLIPPPLQDKTNEAKPKPLLRDASASSIDGARCVSSKNTVHHGASGSGVSLPSHTGSTRNLRPQALSFKATKGPQEDTPGNTPSLPNNRPSSTEKPRHELPIYALAQTLRASSIGATMAPGIPNEPSGLGWSKYAPGSQDKQDCVSEKEINQRTAQTIARQAEIDARLSKLRSRRDPATEKRDEKNRTQIMEAQKAASEEQARLKAKKKAEEEAARIEAERREKEKKEEAERIEREKQDAERLKREKEEAERLKREQEEAERLKKEQEEAERLKREQEETERIRREEEQAKRLEAERLEAERIKREKEEAAEAALRAKLLEKVDQMEEDALTETQTRQMDLQKDIEQATIRQRDILTKINNKRTQLDEAQEVFKHIETEYQDLKETEASINAQIEANSKKRTELQNESELVMERAATMRRKIEDKSIRSVYMLNADLTGQAYKRAEIAPEYGKTLFGNESATKSMDGSLEVAEEPSEENAGARLIEINFNDKSNNNNSVQAKDVNIKSEPTDEDEAKGSATQQMGAVQKKTDDVKNLENQLNFEEWPSQEARPFGGAQKRLVKLTNLPIMSTVSSIQALVWGGRIEKIEYSPGNNFAWVLFMRGEDCEKYFKATANGINYPDDPNRIIWVEMGDPITVNERLRGTYEAGHTRCVRAVGADEDWGQLALTKLASAKNRKLERIVNGANPKGLRVVEFRFTNITDAGYFKAELQNDIDWEHCNIYFGTDPCEIHDGIHLGVN